MRGFNIPIEWTKDESDGVWKPNHPDLRYNEKLWVMEEKDAAYWRYYTWFESSHSSVDDAIANIERIAKKVDL